MYPMYVQNTSKKFCPIVKIEYIMRIGEDFFGIQYYWVSKNLPQI